MAVLRNPFLKLTAAGLAVTLVFTAMAPALAATPFEDVPPDHWAYQAVNHLVELGIMEGYADGQFRGDRVLTRFELAGILARLLDELEKNKDLQLSPEDAALVERLRKEFAAELALLDGRVTALETQLRQTQKDVTQLKEQNKQLSDQLNRTMRDLSVAKTELAKLNAQGGSSSKALEQRIQRLYIITILLAALVVLRG